MSKPYFPVLRKRYDSEYYTDYPLHFLAAEGSLELIQETIRTGGEGQIYRPVREGETPLHVAIYNRRRDVAEALMDIYEKDYGKVKKLINQKGITEEQAALWIESNIYIACTEEEFMKAKDLETGLDGEKTRLVLLKRFKEEENVAVLMVTEANEKHIQGFIESLEPNGVLSWNYLGPEKKFDSIVQLAAFRGATDIVKRLVANGADLSQAGRNQMTPLMEACSALEMDMVRLLFEQYGDTCDPLAKDKTDYTALLHIIPHSNREGFDYVLRKSMAYIMQRYGDNESEAFNKVFRYEGGPTWECVTLVEPYLKLYNYDFSNRYGDRVMLMDCIVHCADNSYYKKMIRQKPELLALADRYSCNVLHCLMWRNELQYVQELYQTFPDRCPPLFETDGAVLCMFSILVEGHIDVLMFLLENHLPFIQTITDKIMDEFFEERTLPDSVFDEPLATMVLHFPELESRVEELQNKVLNAEVYSDDEE